MKARKETLKIVPLLGVLALLSCGDSTEPPPPVLELAFSESAIDLEGVEARYAADVAYGEAERNVFDIYLPDCSEPTALVIFFHGGGFTGGNKSAANDNPHASRTRDLLRDCVAFATVNYRLLKVPSQGEGTSSIPAQGGVRTSLDDAARALQFMRYHSHSLNLAPERVAVYGVSAGAGISLWLATTDDLADPNSEDPVERESSRISAAGAFATQATYDILDWEAVLLPLTSQFAAALGGTDIPTVAAAVGAQNYLLTFLAQETIEGLYEEDALAYQAEVDMLENMDAQDAPIYVHNYNVGLSNLLNAFLHHPLHAMAVEDRADEVGLEVVAYAEAPAPFNREDLSGETLPEFFRRHLGVD
ncbi:MAG: alpha/beta hydrolase fold domain-containing protein [Candidatus Binatia bacterium]|nr:alpha/beta hydrolase fold domain-containing protein [Candidatus Binatia bacterium]